jgi:NADPH-dependent 2,4-dienoyl-CoA reductase/sulfur reductase-like enzyme/rhodanese-related sulfurtransferase
MNKIIIIGGNAAGCKAAARLSRLSPGYSITIIERKPFVSFGSCGLPYYAAGEIDNLFDLSKTSYGAVRDEKYFLDVKGVKVLINTEVTNINTNGREVKCLNTKTNEVFALTYDELIIATGAKPVNPNFTFPLSPRVSSFHTAFDAKNFKETVQKGKVGKAVIIGGGFISCELTEALTSLWGIETILIEKENSLLSKFLDAEFSKLIEKRISENNIEIHLSAEIEKIELNQDELPVIFLKNGRSIAADYVLYNLGVCPDSSLTKNTEIATGNFGGILVNDRMKTNCANVWAAGDCVQTKNIITGQSDYFSLGSLSNRMGRIAADNIAGRDTTFKGVVGNVSLKLFNYIVCSSGLTEQRAQELGFNTGSVVGTWLDRPDYYPEHKNLFGKLIYEKPGLRLLGLQLIGEGEVTRYIDIFSGLLANQKTVYDLQDVEHGYTPAHSSPVSPLNFFGYMAVNQEVDGVMNFNPGKLDLFNGIFIDVREDFETAESQCFEKAIHKPLTTLRTKMGEFSKEQEIMFICEKGSRSYEAARIFINNGYKNISYLGGGLVMYKELDHEFNALAEPK